MSEILETLKKWSIQDRINLVKSVQATIDEDYATLRNYHQEPGAAGDYTGPNPWEKDSFNLTMQAKILKEDPELAKTLQAQAK